MATRRSKEVLAGMLTRTSRDAHMSQPGQRHSRHGRSGSLTLLRAGCPRPVVQHLYRSEEIGPGKAMELSGNGDSSDLDSGEVVADKDVAFHEGEASTTVSAARERNLTGVYRLAVFLRTKHG